jgi:protein TonB
MSKFSVLSVVGAAIVCLGTFALAQESAASPHDPLPSPLGTTAATLLSKVDPVYPTEARAAHAEGMVVLDAVISKRGEINSLKVVSGDQIFQASTLEAVTLWRFKPYLVDGSPAAVETKIKVKYSYGGSEEPQVESVLQEDAAVAPPHGTPKFPRRG